ncbi:MAG TPA: sensor histidine kinase [Agriterribacter sp.]|nr:sensor histidine kinase [Agriterribacter sp.]
MKPFCLFFIVVTISCFSCKDKKKINLENVPTTNAEARINYTFEQIVTNDNLPMDSLKVMFQQLDSLNTENKFFLSKKDIIRAIFYRKNGSFDLAKLYYNNALEKIDTTNAVSDYAYVGLGISHKHLGNFPDALNFFQQSIAYNEKYKDTDRLAGTYASLAQLHYEKNDTTKAKQTIQDVFTLLENKPTGRPYLIALHTLANIEAQNGNYEKAMDLDIKGMQLSEKANNEAAKITFQDNLARCYLYFLKDYDKAKFYFNQNLNIDKKLNNPNWIADTYINLAEVETAEKKFTTAKIYLDSAIHISTESKQLNNSLKSYASLTQLYKAQGNYQKALETQEIYNKQYKKYLNEKSENAFAAYNIIYETEKKEIEIVETKLISKQKNIWLILLGGSVVLGFVIFRNFKAKTQHKQQQLSLENELLKEQTHSKIQEQRLEISRDLHDSLGAQLTLINSILDGLKNSSEKLDEVVNSKINTLSDFSENSIAELKNTLWVLNSKEIHLNDLKTKILNFIKNASEAKEDVKFNFNFDVSDNFNLNSKQAVNLFRAVQEIINNALKYADASEIKIDVQQPANNLIIKISDDGKGFDYEKEKHKSYGLQNIKTRIEAVNGNIHLETDAGKGTTYTIQIVL